MCLPLRAENLSVPSSLNHISLKISPLSLSLSETYSISFPTISDQQDHFMVPRVYKNQKGQTFALIKLVVMKISELSVSHPW